MAIKLVDSNWNPTLSGSTNKYVMDSASEASALPEAISGSTAIAVDTGAAFIVNASGNWVETSPAAIEFMEMEE